MKRIVIFVVITFALTYAYEFGVVYPLVGDSNLKDNATSLSILAVGAAMLFPAIGVVITRLVTKEGFKNTLIKPVDFRHTWKFYLLAWFGPTVFTAIGMLAYFLIFPNDFDPTMSSMIASIEQASTTQGDARPPADMLQIALFSQLAIGILIAPVLNIVTCFGEEWGWRGYLLPKVNEKLSFIPTLLVTGVIWGLWHAPITALGHNYGLGYVGWPFLGIAAMCVFCIIIGTFFSYITIKAKSCIPAALAHGALNGLAGAGLYFTVSGGNPFIGPAPMGIIGGCGYLAFAVIICIVMRKAGKNLLTSGTADASPDPILASDTL